MVTMIIVEDENFERRSLKECIDWGLIGVCVAGEASNGADGLRLAMELKPDIVLTDVKMHLMDGIEMAKAIKRSREDVIILFLSSYDHFEYAQEAIAMNAYAYLTKPIEEGKLLRAVKGAADKVVEKNTEHQLHSKMQTHYEQNKGLARKALFLQILNGWEEHDRALLQGLDLLWLEQMDKGCLFLLVFEHANSAYRMTERLEEFLRRSRWTGIAANTAREAMAVLVAEPEGVKEGTLSREIAGLMKDAKLKTSHFVSVERSVKSIGEAYMELLGMSMIRAGGSWEYRKDRSKSKEEIVEGIKTLIEERYEEPLTIESIARMLHFTPNYIGAVFKSERKQSINNYLMKVRLQKAMEKMADTTLTLQEIAEGCGYENLSYFHVQFKKETNMTPSEYRQSL